MPNRIISDRGPQFSSRFWKVLCQRLGIEHRQSTGFFPQTDGQTESFNATMEEYLWLYVNHHQDDWVDCLPMCEIAANNAISDSTQVSPFFANFGKDPRMNFDLDQPVTNSEEARAHEATANPQKIHDLVWAEMTTAQYHYWEAYDKTRRPAP